MFELIFNTHASLNLFLFALFLCVQHILLLPSLPICGTRLPASLLVSKLNCMLIMSNFKCMPYQSNSFVNTILNDADHDCKVSPLVGHSPSKVFMLIKGQFYTSSYKIYFLVAEPLISELYQDLI